MIVGIVSHLDFDHILLLKCNTKPQCFEFFKRIADYFVANFFIVCVITGLTQLFRTSDKLHVVSGILFFVIVSTDK